MQIGAPLIADGEPAEAIEPGQRALHHPAMPAKPLTRLDTAPGNARDKAPLPAGGATARVIVALVGVQLVRAPTGTATSAARLPERRDRVQRRFHEPRVVDVGRREPHGEGDASGVDHTMALRARFAAVRRIRPDVFAPLLAATLAESSQARDQSSLSASAKRCSSVWCRRSHTPACCQSRSRRQQVIPLPQPSSWGKSSQPMPLFRTNRMPVKAARSLMRGRPPLGLGDAGGSSGATTAHSSSLTRGLLIPPVYHPFC